jgi:transposase
MRTIGIDLAVRAEHRAVVADEHGEYVTPVVFFHTAPVELDRLLVQARASAPDCELQAVMEATGMSWFPVAVYLHRQGVRVYVVNSQQVADLRRYYKRHAKSDRIDARVMARLPLVNPDQLHPLSLASANMLACQRGCRELDRLAKQTTASRNRLRALDRWAWPGLETAVFSDPFELAGRWFRQYWYDPRQVLAAGATGIRQHWQESGLNPADSGEWAEPLVQLAQQVQTLYGGNGAYVDYAFLQAEVQREQARLQTVEDAHHTLQLKTVRRLYRQLHPSRRLETIKGVGQDGAAVYASFIGDPKRFGSVRACRSWSGLIPDSRQSANTEAKGLHITQAGPNLVKKFAYLDADTARQWDPQLAALYYDQMVHKGKHHNQALCAVATHLLDRILVVLREDRPYELRDVAGRPLTTTQAREIVLRDYVVPDEIRRRNNKLARQRRADRRAEHKQKREIAPVG